jgi:hypothetical protein
VSVLNDTLTAERDGLAADTEVLKADLARARADLATEVEARNEAEKRLTDVVTAQRHVFADAMGRMVRREVSKAKSYQATPAKLSTWLEAFYDRSEEDIFTEALLPAVRLHLAWLGSDDDPATAARGIAREHFAESKRVIGEIVAAGPDGFGEVLQRTLSRWESTRADDWADQMARQEIRHAR